MRDIQGLTAAVQQINDALSTLNRLDTIESDATRKYGRLVIHRDYQSYNDFSADEKAICSSMHDAGKRRAAELGREARTAAIEKARADALAAKVEGMEKALKPFAKEAVKYDPDDGDGDFPPWDSHNVWTIGDLRTARAALGSGDDQARNNGKAGATALDSMVGGSGIEPLTLSV